MVTGFFHKPLRPSYRTAFIATPSYHTISIRTRPRRSSRNSYIPRRAPAASPPIIIRISPVFRASRATPPIPHRDAPFLQPRDARGRGPRFLSNCEHNRWPASETNHFARNALGMRAKPTIAGPTRPIGCPSGAPTQCARPKTYGCAGRRATSARRRLTFVHAADVILHTVYSATGHIPRAAPADLACVPPRQRSRDASPRPRKRRPPRLNFDAGSVRRSMNSRPRERFRSARSRWIGQAH